MTPVKDEFGLIQVLLLALAVLGYALVLVEVPLGKSRLWWRFPCFMGWLAAGIGKIIVLAAFEAWPVWMEPVVMLMLTLACWEIVREPLSTVSQEERRNVLRLAVGMWTISVVVTCGYDLMLDQELRVYKEWREQCHRALLCLLCSAAFWFWRWPLGEGILDRCVRSHWAIMTMLLLDKVVVGLWLPSWGNWRAWNVGYLVVLVTCLFAWVREIRWGNRGNRGRSDRSVASPDSTIGVGLPPRPDSSG